LDRRRSQEHRRGPVQDPLHAAAAGQHLESGQHEARRGAFRAWQDAVRGSRRLQARLEKRSGVYAYEQRKTATLDPGQARQFRANKPAWDFFQSQPPSYRQTATWWVISAKREETRERRLATLIEDSAAGRRIGPLTRKTT
jgi:hypothetical protein